MRFSPGSEATLEAVFTDSYGNLIDPTTINVDIFDAEGTQVLDNGVPTRISLGYYQYVYLLPEDAPRGLWRIEWQAIVEGLNAFGEEVFEVELAGVVQPSESVLYSRLRSRLGEVSRLAPEEEGSDTFFSNDAIADMIVYADGDLDLATYEGWKRKAAHLARLIDVSESGSDRVLSQRYRQAKSMLDFWAKMLSDTEDERILALTGRVTGRVVNLRKTEEGLQTPFSGYSENIRPYQTHRLLIPAIISGGPG